MPDGKGILFLAASEGGFLHVGRYSYDVYRLDLETGSIERLTNGPRNTTSLKVFSDGKTAVFIEEHENWHGTPIRSQIYLLDLRTRKLRPLTVTRLD